MAELGERRISVRSLTEPVAIDAASPMGRAMYGIIAVFAQLRIDTIRENTLAGLDYARSQGRVGGRPTVMTPERRAAAQAMCKDGASYTAIATALNVSRATATKLAATNDEGAGQLERVLQGLPVDHRPTPDVGAYDDLLPRHRNQQ